MKKGFLFIVVLSLTCVVSMGLITGSVQAASADIYLKFDDIKGESKIAGREGWIEVRDVVVEFDRGDPRTPSAVGKLYNDPGKVATNSTATPTTPSHNPSSASPGRTQGSTTHTTAYNSSVAQQKSPSTEAGEGTIRLVSIVKQVDNASPLLRRSLETSHVFPSIVIEYVAQKPDGTPASRGLVVRRIEIGKGTIAAIQPGPARGTEKLVIKSRMVVERTAIAGQPPK